MVAYHLLTTKRAKVKGIMDGSGEDEPVAVKVEKMKKIFKTHRCAMEFDSKFIKCAVQTSLINLTGPN